MHIASNADGFWSQSFGINLSHLNHFSFFRNFENRISKFFVGSVLELIPLESTKLENFQVLRILKLIVEVDY